MTRRILLLAVCVAGCKRGALLERGDAEAVVLVTHDAGSGSPPTALEHEPNETLGTAQRLDVPDGGALLAGALTTMPATGRGDVDLYRIDVPASSLATPTDASVGSRRLLAAVAEPEAGRAVTLAILDDRGNPLVTAVGGVGERTGVPNLSVGSGTNYFLRVKSSAGEARDAGARPSPYQLSVRFLDAEAFGETEINDKAPWATRLEGRPVEEVAGYFGWRRDEDWYRYSIAQLPESGVLTIELEGVEGVTASLQVLDAASQPLVTQHGRTGERVAVRNLRVGSAAPDGFIYVVVRADKGYNLDTRYVLRVRSDVPDPGSELEPNDAAAHAQPVGEGTYRGHLPSGDVDVFRFQPSHPVELDCEVIPPERVDVRLEIVRASDDVVLARSDVGKRREPERVPNLFVDVPVLIRLVVHKGDGNPDDPYELHLSSREAAPGAEREPNDKPDLATVLAPSVPGSGLLFPPGDVDFWRIDAVDPALPQTLTFTGVGGLSAEVDIQDRTGRRLADIMVEGPHTASRLLPMDRPLFVRVQASSTKGSKEPKELKKANAHDRYSLSIAP